MAANHLGQAFDHHIGAEFQRPGQYRRGEGIVHQQQAAALPGHLCEPIQINQVQERVRHRLDEQHFGRLVEGRADLFHVAGVDECGLHAEASQLLAQQLGGPAVEPIAGDDPVALLDDGK